MNVGVSCLFTFILNYFNSTLDTNQSQIIFRGFNIKNESFTKDDDLLKYCSPSDNYTIIVHGYLESYGSPWVQPMIANFLVNRGGCVFFMDYSYYALSMLYPVLLLEYDKIRDALTNKLLQLESNGFNASKAFLFGFSFGAQVCLGGAYNFGPKKIARIDLCDPTGVGFPPDSPSFVHANDSAVFLQCIHTSWDFGTSLRVCQKDINMGRCGQAQAAAELEGTVGSHKFCPIFYNNTFMYDFPLVPKVVIDQDYNTTCINEKTLPNTTINGNRLTMGYRLDLATKDGEYYANSCNGFPYNCQ